MALILAFALTMLHLMQKPRIHSREIYCFRINALSEEVI